MKKTSDNEIKMKMATKKQLMEEAGIPMNRSSEYDLHHKDMTLKRNNKKRYHQWRIDDVILLTRVEHMRLHMKDRVKKGSKKSKSQRGKISESVKDARKQFAGKKILIYRPAQEAVCMSFDSCAEAARWIGCTKQLVSQCIRGKNHSAYGYSVQLIDGLTEINEEIF